MYEIIPFKSVGPFEFKKSIDEYLSAFEFEFIPKETDDDWNTYILKDGMLEIYTGEDLLITSIACRGDIYLYAIMLIEMDINVFWEKFNMNKINIKHETVFFHDDTEQEVYDIDDLGLQLWVDKYDKIVTVFVSGSTS
ncbi:hypothetical protein SAMN05428988_4468 [Chitinophaga sp. YR573]|uniref:hypothetical protein n=1 Tax=Chitinophaga sp. YR573 TaxID=1881040 RepID=UPI0008C38D7F|nr:hypothetical protein [Chitinophaga sp. YR573]SEW36237.1 hypothetical protein SAMN05428988_4468 [Chitinophaga sp. YR573]